MKNVVKRVSVGLALGVFLVLGNSTNINAQSCEGKVCVGFAAEAEPVSSEETVLTNAFYSAQLLEPVLLTQQELQTISDTELDMELLLQALQTATGSVNVSELATQNLTFNDLVEAAALATSDPNAQSALNNLSNQVINVDNITFQFGDFIDLTNYNPGSGETINAENLIIGSISQVNYNAILQGSPPVSSSVSGNNIGANGVINNIEFTTFVTEPAKYVCGVEGAQFSSASTRIKMNVDLVDTDKSTELQTAMSDAGVTGISGANLVMGDLELYFDVGKSEGVIQTIDYFAQTVSIQAKPGNADMYLGSIDDAIFFSNTPINPATDLDFTNIGSFDFNIPNPLSTALVPLPDIDVNTFVQVKSYSKDEQDTNTETLFFTGPYSETQTAGDGAAYTQGLISAIVNNSEYRIVQDQNQDSTANASTQQLIDAAISDVTPLAKDIFNTSLQNEMLGPVISTSIEPILSSMGTGLGEADVTVDSVTQSCSLSVSGSVYEDSNHNSMLDNGETGTGVNLFAKIIDESNANNALQAVTVNASTGSYTFSNINSGSYSIIIDDNNLLTDVSSSKPAGWIGMQNRDQKRTDIQVTNTSISGINFGLYHGGIVSGSSFYDNGKGNGTPYNAVRDGEEGAIFSSGISITTEDESIIIDATTTNGAGEFTLWIPSTYTNSLLKVKEFESVAYIDVSGGVGTTNGSYSQIEDVTTFSFVSGQEYTGVRFGNVEVATFSPNGQQYATPGSVIFYPHVFKASSEGQVELTTSGVSSSSNASNWSVLLYEDLNCNGSIDASEPIIETKNLTAGEQVCILAKVFVPVQSSLGENYTLTIASDFELQGTGLTRSSKVTDITTVSDATGAGLRIEKSVDKATAFPREEITYTLTYFNSSSEPVSQISINDATPAYTTFVSASCDETPSEITACTITAPPNGEAGSIEWVLTGEFLPGRTMKVSYKVFIQ